jgi:protein-L-isoaspartate(D-aspartate) O-methyltransferase
MNARREQAPRYTASVRGQQCRELAFCGVLSHNKISNFRDAMTDFSAARRIMVDGQIRTFDVQDAGVLAAMLDVPRERFLPPERAAMAYLDLDVPVGGDPRSSRRLLKPMVFGRMLQAAEIVATDTILDVGCATGYSAAVLARLGARVTALEEDPALAAAAERNLSSLPNVTVARGPLVAGWPAAAPYDLIVVEGGVEVLPPSLAAQLAEGGRLVAVTCDGPVARAQIYRAAGGEISARPVFDAGAAPLPGFLRPKAFAF